MNIYVDFRLPADALDCLRGATRGHTLLFSEALSETVLEPGGLDDRFSNAEIALGQPSPEAVAGAEALRWVHVSSSGITRYDTAAFRQLAREKGLVVTNSAHVYHEACADHVLSFMLAQSRRLVEGLHIPRFASAEAWLQHRGACIPLRGQQVLIVGFGAIGERLAELLKPMGMTVRGYRRRVRGDESVEMVGEGSLADALRFADHVVNLLPDQAATRGFFDAARLRGMKAGATFYNIGRGTTVCQDALLAQFAHDPSFHAWLDVTEPEPLPADHPLWQEVRCRITPHVAGGHQGEALTLIRHFSANLRRFERGEPLLDRVM